jgi:cytoskeleton protein RodZ
MNSMELETQHSLEGTSRAPEQGDTPGKMLKAVREARGLSAQQLCEAIQLEPRLLAAIEADQFEAFHAPVFARGFLRKSATYLGLDPVTVLEAYDRLQGGPTAPTHIPPTISRIKPKRVSPWRLPLLGLGALLAVVLLVWWLVVGLGGLGSTSDGATEAASAEASAAVLTETGFAEMPPAQDLPAAGAPLAVAPPDSSVEAGTDNGAGAGAGADLATPAPAPAPAVATVTPAAAVVAGPEAARTELLVQVAGQCWVSVNGPGGRRLYVGMANPGVLRFAGPGPWQVLLGDSRQAKVSVGGRDLPVPAQQNRENYVVRFTVTADGQLR